MIILRRSPSPLVKLALFFVLLSLAGVNRLVLTERLAGDEPRAARCPFARRPDAAA